MTETTADPYASGSVRVSRVTQTFMTRLPVKSRFWILTERRSGRAQVRSGPPGPNKSGARDDEVKQKERRVDALALGADERRDKLR